MLALSPASYAAVSDKPAPLTATDDAAADAYQAALYAACADTWAKLNWDREAPSAAMAVGAHNSKDAHCFPVRGAESVRTAIDSALAQCHAEYDRSCTIFAENHVLSFWAQELADAARRIQRSPEERKYIRCTRPGLWETYIGHTGPISMTVGYQDGDYRCYAADDVSYAAAVGRSLDFCRERGSSQCEVFAIGGWLREKFLRAGDRMKGVTRDEYTYLYLSCLDPGHLEAYDTTPAHVGKLLWGEWSDDFPANAGRYACPAEPTEAPPEAALQSLKADCANRHVRCLALAYGDTLRPWAKAVADQLRGSLQNDVVYMGYACAIADVEAGLERAPSVAALLGVRIKGERRFDCLWQFGQKDRDAALAALPCDVQVYECKLIAVDGVIEPELREAGAPERIAELATISFGSLGPGGIDAPQSAPPRLAVAGPLVETMPPTLAFALQSIAPAAGRVPVAAMPRKPAKPATTAKPAVAKPAEPPKRAAPAQPASSAAGGKVIVSREQCAELQSQIDDIRASANSDRQRAARSEDGAEAALRSDMDKLRYVSGLQRQYCH